jgi:hypothetical protein
MKKYLISMIAVSAMFMFGAAQAAKHEMPADPVAAACKDKKAGTEVTVDGKKVKCPEAKKK